MYEKLQLEREKMQIKMNVLQMAKELIKHYGANAKDVVKEAEILWNFINEPSKVK